MNTVVLGSVIEGELTAFALSTAATTTVTTMCVARIELGLQMQQRSTIDWSPIIGSWCFAGWCMYPGAIYLLCMVLGCRVNRGALQGS